MIEAVTYILWSVSDILWSKKSIVTTLTQHIYKGQ